MYLLVGRYQDEGLLAHPRDSPAAERSKVKIGATERSTLMGNMTFIRWLKFCLGHEVTHTI